MSDIVERLTEAAAMRDELKERYWHRASSLKREAAEEIARLRQLLSEAETRERDARVKALEDLKSAAERVGKRDAYSDDVIKYAFQRGVVAAAKRFSSAVSALQSEER